MRLESDDGEMEEMGSFVEDGEGERRDQANEGKLCCRNLAKIKANLTCYNISSGLLLFHMVV